MDTRQTRTRAYSASPPRPALRALEFQGSDGCDSTVVAAFATGAHCVSGVGACASTAPAVAAVTGSVTSVNVVFVATPENVTALAALSEKVLSCRACPRLVDWREQVACEKRAAFASEAYWGRPVPGFGDPAARIVLVGLAPAAHGANRTGRMFTGDRSGEWLVSALWRAGLANQPESHHAGDGLELRDAYMTAVVRCVPPANRPSTGERDACVGYLDQELRLLTGARVLVALGSFAFDALARLGGTRPRPRFGHGREVLLPGGRIMIGCYHPSQQNTFTGKLTEEMLDSVLERSTALTGSGPPGRGSRRGDVPIQRSPGSAGR